MIKSIFLCRLRLHGSNSNLSLNKSVLRRASVEVHEHSSSNHLDCLSTDGKILHKIENGKCNGLVSSQAK